MDHPKITGAEFLSMPKKVRAKPIAAPFVDKGILAVTVCPAIDAVILDGCVKVIVCLGKNEVDNLRQNVKRVSKFLNQRNDLEHAWRVSALGACLSKLIGVSGR